VAEELRLFPITTPAGTTIAAPLVTQMRFPPRIVDEVEILVPPGPRGEVGFRIGAAGTQILPLDAGGWIVTDDEVIHWPLEHQHDSGSWEFTSYNTGSFPHTITVRFLVDVVRPATSGAPAAIAAASLGAVPGSDQSLPPAPGLGGIPPPPAPPPGALPALHNLIPPIAPTLAPPGQSFGAGLWTDRAVPDLVASYGGGAHVFYVDTAGQLVHLRYAGGWRSERLSWAGGLVPSGWLQGGQFGGLAHVFALLQAGGVLHLAQAETGGDANSWGGEVLGVAQNSQ
jgi:hypothetical protein